MCFGQLVLAYEPRAASFGMAMIVAGLSNRARLRSIFVLIPIPIVVVEYVALLAVPNNPNAQHGVFFLYYVGFSGDCLLAQLRSTVR